MQILYIYISQNTTKKESSKGFGMVALIYGEMCCVSRRLKIYIEEEMSKNR